MGCLSVEEPAGDGDAEQMQNARRTEDGRGKELRLAPQPPDRRDSNGARSEGEGEDTKPPCMATRHDISHFAQQVVGARVRGLE